MAARTARSRAGNLPAELTSFVGRRHELAEIKRLLTTTRLLTLTGSGGAGKTRLALRAAADVARSLPDGAWLVALAPIDDWLLITQAVFSALGLPDVSSRWSLSALSDYLRGRRLLLVLDNCEHLLDGAAGLAATLLRSCPELRILATSRQALGMPGEVRHRVPPLSLPEAVGSSSPGQIAGSDAVALFVERAAAVQPVDDTNPQTFDAVHRERDNLWSALEHCRRRPGEAAAGVDIVASLINYWLARGPLRDVRRYIESLLPLTEPDSEVRARALISAALFSSALDDAATGQAYGAEARRIAEVLGSADVAGWAAGALLFTAFVEGSREGVSELCRSMLETGGETGMGVVARYYTCQHWLAEGRVDEVIELGEAAVAICKRVGDLYSRGMVLYTLAEARRRRGELAEAEALAREGIVSKHALDDRRGVAALIESLPGSPPTRGTMPGRPRCSAAPRACAT